MVSCSGLGLAPGVDSKGPDAACTLESGELLRYQQVSWLVGSCTSHAGSPIRDYWPSPLDSWRDLCCLLFWRRISLYCSFHRLVCLWVVCFVFLFVV